MRVAVVGAGVAGLGAGRVLQAAGHDVLLFEKSRAVGGRTATRRLGEFTFDTGASSISPRTLSLAPVMLEQLDTSDLVPLTLPIYTHASLHVSPGDPIKNRIQRFVYGSGITKLAKMLAEGQDIRFEVAIEGIERRDSSYVVAGEAFDAVILTPPVPQSDAILKSLGDDRILGVCTYRPCLSVLLGYRVPTPPLGYYALLDPDQRHMLTWLSIENLKCPGRAPAGCTAMVAQLGPQYCRDKWEVPDDEIIQGTIDHIERLYGSGFAHPEQASLKRWRYSQPETVLMFEDANRPGDKVVVAGDGVMGARVEYAYESGVRAAELLMEGK